MADIRILVVDDHAILRDGIRSLLQMQDGFEVVGEAANGLEAVDRVKELQPDVVLMDISMPEMNGLEATQVIKSLYPEIKVLILTQHDDREYVEPLLRAGASGYVLKRSGGREVLTAIRQVIDSGAYLEPAVARQVIEGFNTRKEQESAHLMLTERERQVLRMLVRGMSNKEIAHQLKISAKTVSVHRGNLMSKLNVGNNIDLLHYAQRHGLIE